VDSYCRGAGLAAATERAPLADAVEQRDAAGVRKMLGAGVDVNATQVDGTTALHWAAYQGDAAVHRRGLHQPSAASGCADD
jgi:ankyrin repeat protein